MRLKRCEQKRGLGRLRGLRTSLPEKVLNALDWLEAERECCKRQYVGRLVEETVQTRRACRMPSRKADLIPDSLNPLILWGNLVSIEILDASK